MQNEIGKEYDRRKGNAMKSCCQKKLAAERLPAGYILAPPRVRRYLEAEVDFVLPKASPSFSALELGGGYGRVLKEIAENVKFAFGIDT